MTGDLVDITTGEPASTPLGVCPECKRSAFADLVAALGELAEPAKGGKATVGNRGTYTYLTLPDLLTAVRGPLAAHHLAVMQEVTNGDGHVTVVTVLLHASGYAFRSPALTLRSGSNPQDVGSATTYARRYTLASMVGLAGAEDDDAAQAQHNPPAPPQRPRVRAATAQESPPSDRQVRAMWAGLRGTGWDDDQIRRWVADLLHIQPDWSTHDLNAAQVSNIIDALKTPPTQGGDTTPPPRVYPEPEPDDEQ